VRLVAAEELEPYLEEAFSSTFGERLAVGKEAVRGLDLPLPEALLEPLLEEASRPACFYGRAAVGGQSLVLLRLGNVAALAKARSQSLSREVQTPETPEGVLRALKGEIPPALVLLAAG